MAQTAPTPGDAPRSGQQGMTLLRERYELQERLDHGRIGTVYKAVDRLKANWGDPLVEVLILPREITRDPERSAGFARGLRAVQSLNHPSIIEIRDFEASEEPEFLVLEWVDGESLRTLVDGLAPERLCYADSAAILRAAGEALSYAHARGVVHGDLRAENVLVTGRGGVKVMFTAACLAHTGPVEVNVRDDISAFAALASHLLLDPAGEPVDARTRRRERRIREALERPERHASVPQLLAALGIDPRLRPSRARKPARRRGDDGKRTHGRESRIRGTAARRQGAFGQRIMAVGLVLAAVVVAVGLVGLARERPDWVGAARASVSDTAADLKGASAAAYERVAAAGTSVRAWLELQGGDRDAAEGAATSPADRPPAAGRDGTVAPLADRDGASDPSRAPAATGVAEGRIVRSREGDAAGGGNPSAELPATPPIDRAAEPAPHRAAEPASEPSTRAPAPAEDSAARPAPTDAARPTVGFARDQYLVVESSGVVALEVRRSGRLDEELIILWWTDDGTAVAGDDYADLGRVVDRFAPGEEAKVIYIPITSDSIAEQFEFFDVYVGAATAAGRPSGVPERTRVTIRDDD